MIVRAPGRGDGVVTRPRRPDAVVDPTRVYMVIRDAVDAMPRESRAHAVFMIIKVTTQVF